MSHSPVTLEEKIAIAASGAILLLTAAYWVVQIHGVIHTLQLAYG